jgi:hypothetical protein
LDVRSPGCIWLAIRSAGLRDTLTTWQLLIISGHAQLGYVHSPEEASDFLLQFRPDTSLTPGPAYTLAVNPGVYGSAGELLNTAYQIHFMAVPSLCYGKTYRACFEHGLYGSLGGSGISETDWVGCGCGGVPNLPACVV